MSNKLCFEFAVSALTATMMIAKKQDTTGWLQKLLEQIEGEKAQDTNRSTVLYSEQEDKMQLTTSYGCFTLPPTPLDDASAVGDFVVGLKTAGAYTLSALASLTIVFSSVPDFYKPPLVALAAGATSLAIPHTSGEEGETYGQKSLRGHLQSFSAREIEDITHKAAHKTLLLNLTDESCNKT